MRLANIADRVNLITPDGAIDVERASQQRFTSDPGAAFDRWGEIRRWVENGVGDEPQPFDPAALGPPSPRPRQVFGVGANYADHIAEAGLDTPKRPAIFTKFPTCISGPNADVILPSDRTDWEVELVVVIGQLAREIAAPRAWAHVAGLTIGQDISERRVQFQKPIMQLDLAKSFPTFGPTGPWLVTPDELDDPDDLPIACAVNGEVMQSSRTSNLIFNVSELVAYLSMHVPLLPGDLIFTGTPAGVGSTREPRRYLQPGDEIDSTIDGIGALHNRCIAAQAA